MNQLPDIPLDDTTLDLLEQSLNPGPGAECSSLYSFLDMLTQLGGSDPAAVEREENGIKIMRDPQYSPHDLIEALVAEVRRQRAELAARPVEVTLEEVKTRIGWHSTWQDVALVVLVAIGVALLVVAT